MSKQSLPQRNQEPEDPVHVRHVDVVRRAQGRIGRTPLGAQTIGVWVKPDGTTEDLRSGMDTPWYGETKRQLRRLGGPAGRALTRLAGHIEAQVVVARMGKGETTEATLVLSRRPCGTPPDAAEPFTCHSQLTNLLWTVAPEAKLTVVDPDGRVWMYPKRKTTR